METTSLPGGFSPDSVVWGFCGALAVLLGIAFAWTARPDLAFLVAFGGQFVSVALLYLFVQYRHYGTNVAGSARRETHDSGVRAAGHAGGIVGSLVEASEDATQRVGRRRIAGALLVFSATTLVGCVALTFTGGYLATAIEPAL